MSYAIEKKKSGRGHSYFIDGVKVPRVTNIVKEVVSKGGGFEEWLKRDAVERFQRLLIDQPDSDWTTQEARDILKWSKPTRSALDRGTEVHRALETARGRAGDLNYRKYHPTVQGYIRAAARFWEEECPEVEEVELIVGSQELGYAGTLDARGTLGGSALWDYKTATRSGTTPYLEYHLQLAAYELASQEMGYPPTDSQVIVMLYPDGEYAKFTVRATPDDWRAAMAWYTNLAALREAA